MHSFLLFVTISLLVGISLAVTRRQDYSFSKYSLNSGTDKKDKRILFTGPENKYRNLRSSQVITLHRNERSSFTESLASRKINYQLRMITNEDILGTARSEAESSTKEVKPNRGISVSGLYLLNNRRNEFSNDDPGSKTRRILDISNREGSINPLIRASTLTESPSPPIRSPDARKQQDSTQNKLMKPLKSQAPPNISPKPVVTPQKTKPSFSKFPKKPQNTTLPASKPPNGSSGGIVSSGFPPGAKYGLGHQGLENRRFLKICLKICRRISGQRCSRKKIKRNRFNECPDGTFHGFKTAPTCCFYPRCANMIFPADVKAALFWTRWIAKKLRRCKTK